MNIVYIIELYIYPEDTDAPTFPPLSQPLYPIHFHSYASQNSQTDRWKWSLSGGMKKGFFSHIIQEPSEDHLRQKNFFLEKV